MNSRLARTAESFFESIARRPRTVLAVLAAIAAALVPALLLLRFDNSPDSFLPPEHPALISKKRIERTFGLEDPMLLAVVAGRPDGIYSEKPLRLIEALTRDVREILGSFPGETRGSVYSLATEYDVELIGGILNERPFLDPFPRSDDDFRDLKASLGRIELYTGVLVSMDGSAGALVILPPPGAAGEVHAAVSDIARSRARECPDLRLVLAGEAAVRSTMGEQVARDGFRLNPLCVGVIGLFLLAAFRNAAGVILPFLVVGWASIVMLGAMALAGSPIYIITNAILVTVVSLGVADTIPVQAEYYAEMGRDPAAPGAALAVRAMSRMWLPVIFTCVTDMAGFLSFVITGVMPPLEAFGLFTSIGCAAALVASLTLLPACLSLLDPAAPAHRKRRDWAFAGPVTEALGRSGRLVLRRPLLAIAIAGLVLAGACAAALAVRVDQSMESAFDEESDIVRGNRLINRLFHGTYFLDVLVESEKPGGLLEPSAIRAIGDLEAHARTLPRVSGSLSLAGFTRKLNQILGDWAPAAYTIPEDAEAVREAFALLDASPSKKADFLHIVDPTYRISNVRLRLSSGWYTDEQPVVSAMEAYIAKHFPAGGPLRAELSGRVNMDCHWVRLIVASNISSLLCTLATVFVLLCVMFRSVAAGLISLVPVAMAVAATYAAMGAGGIELGIGTSMFAALAMGVGINFPIHVLERLRSAIRDRGMTENAAYDELFALTGKALLFDALAVSLGFLALLVSDLPILRHFGLMIAISIAAACVSSLAVVPPIVKVLRPRFVYGA